MVRLLFSIILLLELKTIISSNEQKRKCFSEYSDFFHRALEGEWSEISNKEWEENEATGRRKKVL